MERKPKPGAKSLSTVFPGRKVTLTGEGGQTVEVTIRPMPFHCVPQYGERMADAWAKLQARGVRLEDFAGGADTPEDIPAVAPGGKPEDPIVKVEPSGDKYAIIAAVVISELSDLVNDCVDGIDLYDPCLPHWLVPGLVAEWFRDTFSDPRRVRAWVEAVRTILETMPKMQDALNSQTP